ncbi:ROK family protein [Paenibacillus sp. MMS20-IR301]|uniref:ROK family protein n=1 Tax=Paenibacillus sp. MMS20-IR301 TaxID=2895946 RepID=UPI0028E4BA9A|nr:ROK family protein [Paenibacillus sp. MMS20-IR301]WNS43971.1 ROK family protein [Paenibacillus sp. MMS20-IR301]
MRIGAIEAGGTKFICGIGDENGVILEQISFPTNHPGQTMPQVIEYFQGKEVEAIGVGSFGPIDLSPGSPAYGCITTTPKPGWANYNLLGALKQVFPVPFGWDTDVNAAAYGEVKWGAARGLSSCLYMTVGTGIGVGVYSEGRLVHGLVHPEGGHVPVRRHPEDDYAGHCPYHGDCLEGMAAGPAIEARWGKKGYELPAEHKAWEIEAYYLAQSITQAILLLSPHKIILGGGVMQQVQLYPLIRRAVLRNLNGYVNTDAILERMDEYITAPGLGQQAGLCGALALGLSAARGNEGRLE